MTASNDDLRWLLVGTGDISNKRVAPALASTPGSRLVGVCSRDGDRARAFAQTLSVAEAYGDLNEALRKTSANAVYIATAVHQHVSQAIAALTAGKHVLVEKPLGLNGREAERVVEAAKAAGVTSGCAYYRRCSDRYDYARKMIAAGEFGKILMVRMLYHAGFNPADNDPKKWRVDPALSGGGPLADMASHMIDLVVGLLGTPHNIIGSSKTLVHAYEAEDTATFILNMNDGAQVGGSFSWASDTWAHEFEIIGSKAKLRWSPCDAGKVVKTVGRDITELDQPSAGNVHVPLIADFVSAVRERRSPRVSLAEAAITNDVLDAIYRSSASGQVVNL